MDSPSPISASNPTLSLVQSPPSPDPPSNSANKTYGQGTRPRTTWNNSTHTASLRIRSFRRAPNPMIIATKPKVKTLPPPTSFPPAFSTYIYFTTAKGEEIPLLHRDKVTKVLKSLDFALKPIVSKFNVRYTVLCENHPQEKTVAFTNRLEIPSQNGEVRVAHCIRLRVRNPACPNDTKRFYNRCTLLAVLFHELAHVRFMNHGKEFMFLLRDIYWYASEIRVFRAGETNQMPSCRLWEARLYSTGGGMTDKELMELHTDGCSHVLAEGYA